MDAFRLAGEYAGRTNYKLFVVTLRLHRDGGKWPSDAARSRLADWERFSQELPTGLDNWFDVEREVWSEIVGAPLFASLTRKAKILLSHHHFSQGYTFQDLVLQEQTMAQEPVKGLKFAVSCRNLEEVSHLFEFMQYVAQRWEHAAVFSMGELAKMTRFIAPALGCGWTYAPLLQDSLAPGQIPHFQLRDWMNQIGLLDASQGLPSEFLHGLGTKTMDCIR